MRHLLIFLLGFAVCASVRAQQPGPAEQQRTLEAARQMAINYARALPDFICTEKVQRERTAGFRNASVDRLTIQLSYFDQREHYKLVAIDGNHTEQSFESLDGLISGGEFGSLLLRVFEPSSAAEFKWKSVSNIRRRRAAVYTYRVARSNSHYLLGYRDDAGKMLTAVAGYRGEVALNGEDSKVLRLTAEADEIPKESGILQSSVVVDYDLVPVAGRSYLLPVQAVAQMARPHREIRNVVTFVDYRKFVADSKIDFR